MKNIKTTLNNLKTVADSEQLERINNLISAIDCLEINDIDSAEGACYFVQAADYNDNCDIISADILIDIVRGLDDIQSMTHMLSDIGGHACFYKLDGYGWAVDISADDLALYIEELTAELVSDIN